MSKETKEQQNTAKELKALFLIGPDMSMDPDIENILKSRDDCLIVGDGKSLIDPDELQQILKDKNLKIGPNTRIDISAHGNRKANGKHSINLFEDMELSEDIFTIINNIASDEVEVPLYIHLWSCHGGSANKDAKKLDAGSVLVTHIEAKEDSSKSCIQYACKASLKRYLDPKNNLTPHQQFILDIQENYKAATFNHITEEGEYQKFKFTRIPKETSKKESRQEIFMADVLKQIDDHDTIHDFVKDFFAKEGERFKKNFPTVDVEDAITNVSNIDEETAKKFAQGVLIHTFNVENQITITNAKNLLARLQSKGVDINGFPPDDDMNLLHEAAYKGYDNKVKLLLEHGADVTIRNKNGKTPLYLAAESGNLTVVEALVAKNPDTMTMSDKYGQTPLHLAAACGHLTIVKELVDRNPDTMTMVDIHEQTPLHTAAYHGQTTVVKELVDRHPDTTTLREEQGRTPLHCAAYCDNVSVIKELIDKNPDTMTMKDKRDQIPLHVAAKKGHAPVVKELVDRNPDIMIIKDKDGQTPLHLAAKNGRKDVVDIFIKHAPNIVNVRDNEGLTVSDLAAKNGYTDIVKLIEESKLKRVRQAAQSINIELKKQKLLATKISSSTANISHSPKKSQRKTSWSV